VSDLLWHLIVALPYSPRRRPPTPQGRGAQGGLQCQHGAALWRMPVECPLLMGLAPWLLGLGIEVRHHRTFLACLAFTLIRLTAFGFHGCPSLPALASPDQAPGRRYGHSATQVMVQLNFIV